MNVGLGAILVRNRTIDEVEANLPFSELLIRERDVMSQSDLVKIPKGNKGIMSLNSNLVKL